MKRHATFALIATAPFALAVAHAQATSPAADPQTGQEICGELAAFLEERGGTIKAAQTTITLDQVRGYLRDDNRFACRSAISVMRSSRVVLPQNLLNAIGKDTEQPATQPQR